MIVRKADCVAGMCFALFMAGLLLGTYAHAATSPLLPSVPDFNFYFSVRGYHRNKSFGEPTALALDSRTHAMYVADAKEGVIDAFNFQGIPRFQYGAQTGLKSPVGVAVDSHGNIFVSESEGGPVKIIDAKGQVTMLALSGVHGEEAPKPGRMAFDRFGNLYVVDRANCRIYAFDKNLKPKFQIGGIGYTQGHFKMLQDVAVDRQGRIYALDSMMTIPVQVFDRKGNFIYRFGNLGEGDQDISFPAALFIDRNDQVWIVDKTEHALKVFDRAGVYLRTFGTYGLSEGALFYPIDGAIDDLGHVYVLQEGERGLQVFTLNHPFEPFNL